MKKFLIPALIIIGLALYLTVFNGGRTTESFTSTSTPLSFEYRTGEEGYVLLEPLFETPSNESLAEFKVLMLKQDYDSVLRGNHENGEYPPTHSIQVFRNPNNLALQTWLVTNPLVSNLELKMGEFENLTVSGEPALIYRTDGLYPSKHVVWRDGDYLYFATEAYLDPDSPLYRDFDTLLDSVKTH